MSSYRTGHEFRNDESVLPPFGADEGDGFSRLFTGEPGETCEERAVRLQVAREVLAELYEEGRTDGISRVNAHYARALLALDLWVGGRSGLDRLSCVRAA